MDVLKFQPAVAVEVIVGQAGLNGVNAEQIRPLVTQIVTQLYQRGCFVAALPEGDLARAIAAQFEKAQQDAQTAQGGAAVQGGAVQGDGGEANSANPTASDVNNDANNDANNGADTPEGLTTMPARHLG